MPKGIKTSQRWLKQSKEAVAGYKNGIKALDAQGASNLIGKPCKLTLTLRLLLQRKVSKGKLPAKYLNTTITLPSSVSRTRAVLNSSPHLNYTRMKRGPFLIPSHFSLRKLRVISHVTWNEDRWASVIWLDEKKFNFNNPDRWASYWHDLRKEKRIFSKGQSGRGSAMVWPAFSGSAKSDICFFSGTQIALAYCKTLEHYRLPFAYYFNDNNFISQQDGASIHTPKVTKEWFPSLVFVFLDWPEFPLDLPPI